MARSHEGYGQNEVGKLIDEYNELGENMAYAAVRNANICTEEDIKRGHCVNKGQPINVKDALLMTQKSKEEHVNIIVNPDDNDNDPRCLEVMEDGKVSEQSCADKDTQKFSYDAGTGYFKNKAKGNACVLNENENKLEMVCDASQEENSWFIENIRKGHLSSSVERPLHGLMSKTDCFSGCRARPECRAATYQSGACVHIESDNYTVEPGQREIYTKNVNFAENHGLTVFKRSNLHLALLKPKQLEDLLIWENKGKGENTFWLGSYYKTGYRKSLDWAKQECLKDKECGCFSNSPDSNTYFYSGDICNKKTSKFPLAKGSSMYASFKKRKPPKSLSFSQINEMYDKLEEKKWLLHNFTQIKLNEKCLEVKDNIEVQKDGIEVQNGYTVKLEKCDKDKRNQVFMYDTDKNTIKFPFKQNLCVAALDTDTDPSKPKLKLEQCDRSNLRQQWNYNVSTRLLKSSSQGQCLVEPGNYKIGDEVFNIRQYDDGEQYLDTGSFLSVPIAPRCLTKTTKFLENDSQRTKIEFQECDPDNVNQQLRQITLDNDSGNCKNTFNWDAEEWQNSCEADTVRLQFAKSNQCLAYRDNESMPGKFEQDVYATQCPAPKFLFRYKDECLRYDHEKKSLTTGKCTLARNSLCKMNCEGEEELHRLSNPRLLFRECVRYKCKNGKKNRGFGFEQYPKFTYEQLSEGGGLIKPMENSDLCVYSKKNNELGLKSCDKADKDQLFEFSPELKGSGKQQVSLKQYNSNNDGLCLRFGAATHPSEVVSVRIGENLCLDSSERRRHGKLYAKKCDGSSNQSFIYEKDTGLLKFADNLQYCVDASQRNRDGGLVHVWTCDKNNKNQQWQINKNNQLKIKSDNFCLHHPEDNRVSMWNCAKKKDQHFTVQHGKPDPVINIRIDDTLCLDSNEMRNGGKINVKKCDPSSTNQRFIHETGSGLLRFAGNTNYCVDASQRNRNGGKIHVWSCSRSNKNQQWEINRRKNTLKASLKNKYGKCLDNPERRHTGKVHMWQCSTTNKNQEFEIFNANVMHMGECDEKQKFDIVMSKQSKAQRIHEMEGTSQDDNPRSSDKFSWKIEKPYDRIPNHLRMQLRFKDGKINYSNPKILYEKVEEDGFGGDYTTKKGQGVRIRAKYGECEERLWRNVPKRCISRSVDSCISKRTLRDHKLDDCRGSQKEDQYMQTYLSGGVNAENEKVLHFEKCLHPRRWADSQERVPKYHGWHVTSKAGIGPDEMTTY